MGNTIEASVQAVHPVSHQSSKAALLKQVRTDDLIKLKPKQVFTNVTLSWPWLILGLALAHVEWYLPAIMATGMFYMMALRQAHDSYHHSIGLSKRHTHFLLHILSVAMMCSTHAIGYTHLQHHKHTLNEHDIEGSWSRQSGWMAILKGPVFYYRIQKHGLNHGSDQLKQHAKMDMALIACLLLFTAITQAHLLIYHLISMLICSYLVGFFAVWSVHHDCDGEEFVARTERNKWLNFATAHLLFHVEHHLFPTVPCNNLPILAKRLDAVAPQLTSKRVL